MWSGWVALGACALSACSLEVAELEPAKDAGAGGVAGSTGGGAGSGGAGSGGTSTGFCANHTDAALCKDFDDGKALGFGFNGVELAPPCTLVLDTQASSSAPNAMRSLIPAGTPDTDSYAYAYGDFAPTAKDVTLAFDILTDVSKIGASADVASISIDPSGKWHVANFELYPQGAHIELGYPDTSGQTVYKDYGLTAFPQKGKWSRVVMHMTRTVKPSLTVTIDDKVVGSEFLPDGYMNDGLRIRVGVSFAPKQTQDFTVHYDNVLVELK
ncbi:MAG: hypothetical protein IPI67_34815 [Myxococcales bacterium]|nr:hypothetical protein [Myxococcales bacterium]